MLSAAAAAARDAVTLEVLRNAFATLVDQMTEQIQRTCTSFVLYSGDCSCCLCDARGDIVMQGTRDIASHVGTMHLTAHAVLERFGADIHAGDVFLVNDPFSGGTHVPDMRVVRPVFGGGELIAMTQANGHWDDVGGSVPGSFDIGARDLYREGLRVPPVRIIDGGTRRDDVIELVLANVRVPHERIGDLESQIEATAIGEARLHELIARHGREVILAAFAECQDYVERLTRAQLTRLPHGSWVTEDYIDRDPTQGEGMIPVRVRLELSGQGIAYDLSGSAPAIGSFHNAARGAAFSALVAGTKMFFPELPLNSGFYRVLTTHLPTGSVVNASPPSAVTGFTSGAYEKIVNSVCELWSQVMPERAIACSFNLEYMLVGGRDLRSGEPREFIWHDWNAGGWGARADRDGFGAGPSYFGAGLKIQPFEGQERLCPVRTHYHRVLPDSGGPGRWRGGVGVEKAIELTEAAGTVASYCCDRERSVVWGVGGGLAGYPHGATLNPGGADERFLGACFAAQALAPGDVLTRPSSGGGGMGDPLGRDPAAVREDVLDGYVSAHRAARDYGVVFERVDLVALHAPVDEAATAALRAEIAARRDGWRTEDPASVAARVTAGELDLLDAVRHYGVVIDRHTGDALPRSTEQLRAAMARRRGDTG
ncbi:MAG TPA: hydantoinase B/oxoprolinase family protein [Solirubrobacteraceae bacterium]|jgi:N-methylhydantoinase B|nr:hydantoinase B/oxoprolinase family protein [Solirubrobacteraceae bacterium]